VFFHVLSPSRSGVAVVVAPPDLFSSRAVVDIEHLEMGISFSHLSREGFNKALVLL